MLRIEIRKTDDGGYWLDGTMIPSDPTDPIMSGFYATRDDAADQAAWMTCTGAYIGRLENPGPFEIAWFDSSDEQPAFSARHALRD